MNTIFKRAIFILLAAIPLFRIAAAADDGPLPSNWKPDLNEAFDYLGDELKDAPQQGANLITARQSEIRDAQLEILYLELFSKLDSKSQKTLRVEQIAWLKKRDQYAKDNTFDEGGTAAPLEYNSAFIEFTGKRIKELQLRLKKLSTKSGG